MYDIQEVIAECEIIPGIPGITNIDTFNSISNGQSTDW